MSRLIAIDLAVIRGHRERLPALRETLRRDHAAMRAEIETVVRRAKAALATAEDELERLQHEYAEKNSLVNDDDIESAYGYVRACRNHEDRVRELAARAKAEMGRIEREFNQHMAAASHDLDDAISSFEAFDAIPVPLAGDEIATAKSSLPGGIAGVTTAAVDLPALPHGHAWISTDELRWNEASNNIKFEKADRADIEVMMRNFMSVIVPMLRHPRGVTREQLYALDVMNGTVNIGNERESLAFAWDCLIGGRDTIAVTAIHPLTGSKHGWHGGRHRALVARSLGWTHIPAKVV